MTIAQLRVLTAICAMSGLGQGSIYYGYGVLLDPMVNGLDASRSAISAGFTVMVLLTGLVAPLVTWLIMNRGIHQTIGLGALAYGTGALLCATSLNSIQLVLGVGLVLGSGMTLMVWIPGQILAVRHFGRRQSVAFGAMVASVGGVGLILAPLFANLLAAGLEWRWVWVIIGCLGTSSGLVALLAIPRNAPGQAVDESEGTGEDSDNQVRWPMRRAVRNGAYLTIIFAGGAFLFAWDLSLTQTVAKLTDGGIAPTDAAFVLSVMGAASVASRMLAGLIGLRVTARYLVVTSFILQVGGIGVLLSGMNLPTALIFALSMGVGNGFSWVGVPLVLSQSFGRRSFEALLGPFNLVQGMVGAMGPLVGAIVFDIIGAYEPAYFGAAAILCLAAVALLMIRNPRQGRSIAEVP